MTWASAFVAVYSSQRSDSAGRECRLLLPLLSPIRDRNRSLTFQADCQEQWQQCWPIGEGVRVVTATTVIGWKLLRGNSDVMSSLSAHWVLCFILMLIQTKHSRTQAAFIYLCNFSSTEWAKASPQCCRMFSKFQKKRKKKCEQNLKKKNNNNNCHQIYYLCCILTFLNTR